MPTWYANRIDVLFLPIEVSRQIHIPEFACFGDYERDLYAQCGAKVGRFYPIGSLKDAQYRETVPSVERAQEYDLCVVSEGAAGTDKEWFPGMEWAIVLILQHAMRFCEKHRRRLCVAGKRPDLKYFELEKSMYTKYLGPDIPIVMPTRYAHSTARLIDGSAVSLAICSTALKEGLGRGNKVLFCNFTSEPRLDFPVDGIWLLTDSSFEEFEKRMLLLLEMDNAEFNKLAKYATHYVMSYDPQKPTTAFLRELIDDAVSK